MESTAAGQTSVGQRVPANDLNNKGDQKCLCFRDEGIEIQRG